MVSQPSWLIVLAAGLKPCRVPPLLITMVADVEAALLATVFPGILARAVVSSVVAASRTHPAYRRLSLDTPPWCRNPGGPTVWISPTTHAGCRPGAGPSRRCSPLR